MAQVAKRQRDQLAKLRGVVLQTDKQARVSSQIGPFQNKSDLQINADATLEQLGRGFSD